MKLRAGFAVPLQKIADLLVVHDSFSSCAGARSFQRSAQPSAQLAPSGAGRCARWLSQGGTRRWAKKKKPPHLSRLLVQVSRGAAHAASRAGCRRPARTRMRDKDKWVRGVVGQTSTGTCPLMSSCCRGGSQASLLARTVVHAGFARASLRARDHGSGMLHGSFPGPLSADVCAKPTVRVSLHRCAG